ncbi:hypothetical protein GCM10012284_12050 [Mangrovihabitans endophyticus]|uniref:Uncharacterized protein n=1 Tax=Mangrovihabitans endophyticus TaxID=1751298 RepID=A0A8J3FMI2_9ACTN|nr:hypothetical protein GCM10012284_12050 [Mangrovihabitans endophyticus]
MEPRSAAAAGDDFPYELRTTCYIEVGNDGSVTQGVSEQAYQRAVAGTSRLFAVWPGSYSSDLFAIDAGRGPEADLPLERYVDSGRTAPWRGHLMDSTCRREDVRGSPAGLAAESPIPRELAAPEDLRPMRC